MSRQITPDQKDLIKKVVELVLWEALDEIALSYDEALWVINHKVILKELLKEHFLSVFTRLATLEDFADEEVKSSSGYFSGYRKPRLVTEQANRLCELFPDIGYANEALAYAPVPQGAEGKFVFPRWQKIALTYNEAVQIVLDKLRVTYGEKFFNCIEGKLGAQYLRESVAKNVVFQKLGDEQKDFNLLVVDGQFGILHRGRSVRRARVVMEAAGQFGFGAFEVGIMLLTHPERLQHYHDLWIECAGDEYLHVADGEFSCVPIFRFGDDELAELEFDVNDVALPHGYYGSSSGFILQE